MPKVTVIISAFNHESYVSETIKSILDQTFRDFELIVVDNGSTDSTYKIIKSFFDPRLKVFRIRKNIGFGYALNFCLKKSQGEYVSLFSSDDIAIPTKLEKQVQYLNSHSEVDAVFSLAQLIDENDHILEKNYYENVFNQKNKTRYQWLNYFFNNGNCICFPTALIKKSIYEKIGYENERLAQLHDFDLWVRLCLKTEIYILQQKLVKFRIRSDNKNVSADTLDNKIRSMYEFSHVLKHYLKIKSVKEFLKIFPHSQEKYKDISDNELIPFYVAREALNVEHVFHQKFALDTLFDLLQNKRIAKKLQKKNNFGYADFIRLTGKYDLYHVQHIAFQEDLVRRLKLEYEDLKYPLRKLKKTIYGKS
ncbi:MAG: Glycosyl transferase family 2 [Candidatus Roizmanbacteria bacterium GW2011_GWC2_37_13]|uniref:Glycosyl transferase family 2 n=1 Tax=Candidatus Roizmanbacteria bacterium GW2011_GWC2_37_13 TaxID=1618486 RepID=A0A0G0IRA9_9BACT|nr:MAG: hypothetical protein US38_C0002G0043 [Candidatus Roizmanbacteria bacterium GW2011_GWC1_37_12]KKQ26694.1 MAG: Glycosyl transferase family 2 [Candidatus Roizmanbacteria bacterium GW2011_GWC2_37_13]